MIRSDEKNEIVAVRMDERLLHGIITTQWIPRTLCDRVMVIDDVVAGDPLKKEVMKLSRPVDKALSIIDRSTAVDHFREGRYRGQRLFILGRDLHILPELLELGIPLPAINIGMYYAPSRDHVLMKRVALSREDVQIIGALRRAGCSFVSQYVPSDETVKLDKVLAPLLSE